MNIRFVEVLQEHASFEHTFLRTLALSSITIGEEVSHIKMVKVI